MALRYGIFSNGFLSPLLDLKGHQFERAFVIIAFAFCGSGNGLAEAVTYEDE
jgi:hypothetical protein